MFGCASLPLSPPHSLKIGCAPNASYLISGSCGLRLYHRLLWPIIYHCSKGLKHFNFSYKPAWSFHFAFSWNFNYCLCHFFFFLVLLLFFVCLFLIPRWKHAWRTARKWKLLLIRENQTLYSVRVSLNRNLELCQTSGWKRMLRRRDLESTNEGKRVSFSQGTRRGLTSAISSHFRDFRTFSVHLLELAKSSHHRLLLMRPEHVLVEKKSGTRALFLLLLLFGKESIVTRMLGLPLGCVLLSEMPL